MFSECCCAMTATTSTTTTSLTDTAGVVVMSSTSFVIHFVVVIGYRLLYSATATETPPVTVETTSSDGSHLRPNAAAVEDVSRLIDEMLDGYDVRLRPQFGGEFVV
jgi:hypothetical protein